MFRGCLGLVAGVKLVYESPRTNDNPANLITLSLEGLVELLRVDPVDL
ncbi:MAG: hypothetical protein WCF33_17775 [Pseudonocardiaceae bacterium]